MLRQAWITLNSLYNFEVSNLHLSLSLNPDGRMNCFFFSVWNSFLRTRWTRPSCENCPSADGGVPFSEFKAVHRWVVSNNFIAEDITPIGASRIGHNHKVNRVLKHSILKVCMCIFLKLPRVNRNFIHS